MFLDVKLSFGPFQVQRRQRREPQSVFYHFSDRLLCQKSGIISIQMESFTCRSLCKFTHCLSMQKEQKRRALKALLPGSWRQKNALGSESGLRSQMRFGHMAALRAAQRRQHLLPQPAFTPSIFRVNGPSQGRSLACNSPLMWAIRAACVSISSPHNDSI